MAIPISTLTSSSQFQNICYCLNVFPTDSLNDLEERLTQLSKEIRKLNIYPDLIPLGFWFPAPLASELQDHSTFSSFKRLLERTGTRVGSLNAFPYNKFHNTSVKSQVYHPDWTQFERFQYTQHCIHLLAQLAGKEAPCCLSTLPGGFLKNFPIHKENEMISAFEKLALYCEQESNHSSFPILIAIEPEPDCLWETPLDFLNFRAEKLSSFAQSWIGLCLDTAHCDVVNTPLPDKEAPIFKIQCSAALQITPEGWTKNHIQLFDEPVYLHQTRIGNQRFQDLSQAWEQHHSIHENAIIHYHLPLFLDQFATGLETSRTSLFHVIQALKDKQWNQATLEIETYTWSVLPQNLKFNSLYQGIAQEIFWLHQQLHS